MNLMAQQGWQCPCCGKVYSPMTSMCYYCPPKVTTASETAPDTDSYLRGLRAGATMERDACAELADVIAEDYEEQGAGVEATVVEQVAAQIRARGEQK